MMATYIAPREFTVAPPAYNLRLIMLLLFALPMLLFLIGVFAFRHSHAVPIQPPNIHTVGLLVLPIAVAFIFTTVLLSWAVPRRRIVLADGVLDITATFYRRKLPVAAFDLDKALVINLDQHREWRPLIKTNGLGMPGLHAGWFRSRRLVKMFCLLTTRDRVLVLPELTGGAMLLSAERPQELLQALREMADGSRRSGY